jgi:hypothetical protein
MDETAMTSALEHPAARLLRFWRVSRSHERGSARCRAAMALDLFAGIPVADYEAAKPWYERLLGVEASFGAHATEAVWELAEHRSLILEEDGERAAGAIHTLFVDDQDARVAAIASCGIEPDERITYPGKARKAIYRDADGNELGSEPRSPQWDPDPARAGRIPPPAEAHFPHASAATALHERQRTRALLSRGC